MYLCSMVTNSGDSTMAPSEVAPFKLVIHPNKSKRLKVMLEQKVPLKRTHSFTFQTYFPTLHTNSKFNLTVNMCSFLVELLKYDSSLVVVKPITKEQIVLATDPLPMNEEAFKKFFTISMDLHATMNQQWAVIRCNLLSECTLSLWNGL